MAAQRPTPAQDKALNLIRRYGPIHTNAIAEMLGIGRRTADKRIAALKAAERIRAAGSEQMTPGAPVTTMWEAVGADCNGAHELRMPTMPVLTKFAGGVNPWTGVRA